MQVKKICVRKIYLYVPNIRAIFAYMKSEILHTAIEKINGIRNLKCELIEQINKSADKQIDAQLIIMYNEEECLYYAEIKSKVVPAQIHRILENSQSFKPYIIIAEYITSNAKEILRKNNIAYADTAGNIYISRKGLYVFTENKKTNKLT